MTALSELCVGGRCLSVFLSVCLFVSNIAVRDQAACNVEVQAAAASTWVSASIAVSACSASAFTSPRHLLLATLSRLSLLLPLGRPQHSLPPRHLLRVAMPTVRGLQGLSRGSTIENVVSVPARNRNAQMFQNKYICLFVDTLIVALGMQSLSLSFHVLAKDLRSAA